MSNLNLIDIGYIGVFRVLTFWRRQFLGENKEIQFALENVDFSAGTISNMHYHVKSHSY